MVKYVKEWMHVSLTKTFCLLLDNFVVTEITGVFIFVFFVDDVIVTGILTAKWSPDLRDVRCDLDPVLIANHVR